MPNINLYQTDTEKIQNSRRTFAFNGGVFFSLGIFLLVLISLGVVRMTSSNFEAKKILLEEEVKNAEATFFGSDIDRVMDFQARISESVNNISSKPNGSSIFSAIETSMVNGVVAKNISYENKKGAVIVKADFNANDFQNVAKQILSFKESGKFSNVVVSGISRDEKGIFFLMEAHFLNNK